MNLFLSSPLCWSYPIDQVMKIAKQFGFNGVEVWAEQVWFHGTTPEVINQAREKYALELTFHAASWDLNLCSVNRGIRDQSIKEIEKSMQLAKEINALNVTVHPGRRTLTNEWTMWHYNKLVEALSYLAGKAEGLGVILSLEQLEHERKEFIIDPLSMNQLLTDLPTSVKVTFDVAHVPLTEDVVDFYKRIQKINKIHISDTTASQYHVPLGTGSIQIESILYMVTEESVPIVLEGYDHQSDLVILQKNLAFLSHYLKSPKVPFKEVVI